MADAAPDADNSLAEARTQLIEAFKKDYPTLDPGAVEVAVDKHLEAYGQTLDAQSMAMTALDAKANQLIAAQLGDEAVANLEDPAVAERVAEILQSPENQQELAPLVQVYSRTQGATIAVQEAIKNDLGVGLVAAQQKFLAAIADLGVVLVDFHADWCGPCKALAPAIDKVEKAYEGKANVVRVDLDQHQEVAQSFGVMTIPTLLLFKDGEMLGALVNTRSERGISAALDAAIGGELKPNSQFLDMRGEFQRGRGVA